MTTYVILLGKCNYDYSHQADVTVAFTLDFTL